MVFLACPDDCTVVLYCKKEMKALKIGPLPLSNYPPIGPLLSTRIIELLVVLYSIFPPPLPIAYSTPAYI